MFDAFYQQGDSEQVCEMLRILITLGRGWCSEKAGKRAPVLAHLRLVVFHSGGRTARPSRAGSWTDSGQCNRHVARARVQARVGGDETDAATVMLPLLMVTSGRCVWEGRGKNSDSIAHRAKVTPQSRGPRIWGWSSRIGRAGDTEPCLCCVLNWRQPRLRVSNIVCPVLFSRTMASVSKRHDCGTQGPLCCVLVQVLQTD